MKMFTNKPLVISYAIGLCVLILLFCTFYYYPIMGHDYSYAVPNSYEFHSAWNDFGVINPHYSPLRCLGLPMWSNPGSVNFGIFHFFSLFTSPIIAVAAFTTFCSIVTFIGSYLFTTLFIERFFVSICLSTGWTLQAHLVNNTIVGHMSYMVIGFFPFILYLIFKKHSNKKQEFFFSVILVFLISQFVFSAAHSAAFIFIAAFLLSLIILKLGGFDFSELKKNFPFIVARNLVVGLTSVSISLPKIIAVSHWLSRYPRKISFINVGFSRVLEYSYYNLLIPTPFDAKSSVGWWYGNWESNQGIFPFLILIILLFLFVKKKYREIFIVLLFLLFLFSVSITINSGVYSELFSRLPVLSSLHVNPRWNTIILLPLFTGVLLIVKKHAYDLHKYIWGILLICFLVFPFTFINKDQNEINYKYLLGFNSDYTRLNYCYEPVFGYNLEAIPQSIRQLDLFGDQLVDPRCYLKDSSCLPGSIINKKEQLLLESYKLE